MMPLAAMSCFMRAIASASGYTLLTLTTPSSSSALVAGGIASINPRASNAAPDFIHCIIETSS